MPNIFGKETRKEISEKVDKLSALNTDLQTKTSELNADNEKMASSFNQLMGYNFELFTGETNYNELGPPKDIVIEYPTLRIRGWEFQTKNHLASLIVTKRVNWQIGSGLLFNANPAEKPFIDYYGKKVGKEKRSQFIKDIEYQFRNFSNTTNVDYEKSKNLHELSRHTDYNACGDGDEFLLMRVKNGYPNLQVISGQCVENPSLIDNTIPKGHTLCEGVESNKEGEVVAYHILIDTNLSNGVYTPNPDDTELKNGTKRVPVYFKGTNIKQAWLYKASDLQKSGETRAMPFLSQVFESLQHVNDYLIANSKNAQLRAQLVIAFEKDQNSTGEKVLGGNTLNIAGMSSDVPQTDVDSGTLLCANKTEYKLEGSGITIDPPKGVTVKAINPTAQSDQAEYLNSALRTISAQSGFPYEVLISTYNSNYTASMGSRSDFQHILDVLTKLITGNQLYKPFYEMFLYLQILKGDIICPPLADAYKNNDIITIAALTNSSFEGTKLKPIDPLKFIKALKEQIPEKYRELIPFNSLEKLVNIASSGGDYENIVSTFTNEVELVKDFEIVETPEVKKEAKVAKLAKAVEELKLEISEIKELED
jgi:capsid protein